MFLPPLFWIFWISGPVRVQVRRRWWCVHNLCGKFWGSVLSFHRTTNGPEDLDRLALNDLDGRPSVPYFALFWFLWQSPGVDPGCSEVCESGQFAGIYGALTQLLQRSSKCILTAPTCRICRAATGAIFECALVALHTCLDFCWRSPSHPHPIPLTSTLED